MLSSQVFNVYQKPTFDDTIQGLKEFTYRPYVPSYQNNDEITITINQSDAWLLMYDAAIIVKGKVTKTAGKGKVSFVNNAGAFFFDSCSYELNGTLLDTVRNPGILSTIRGYLCYNYYDSRHLEIAGWNYPSQSYKDSTTGYFSFRIPLKHLLNYFKDYEFATCGKHTIRMVRARSDVNCIDIDEASGDPQGTTKAKLEIQELKLVVKHVYPNDIIRLDLLQRIKDDKPIYVPYRKWTLHELPALTVDAKREIWQIQTCAAVECPRYVIVAFQTNKLDNPDMDPTMFDHINVTDVRLILNGEYYPHERLRFDFSKNDYVEAFYNYTEFASSYKNITEKQILLDYAVFKNHAIFVIDCSKRIEPLKTTTVDVKLDIEVAEGFPDKTRAYCIIIHDCVMEHHPLSEMIKQYI